MSLLKKLLFLVGLPTMGVSSLSGVALVGDGGEGDGDVSGIATATKNKEDKLQIIKKAGLDCGEEPKEGAECKPTGRKGIGLKVGDQSERSVFFSKESPGKLILRNVNPYSYGLRFTVEGGDIDLERKKEEEEEITIKKLERFESYALELGKKGEKLHLVRKLTAEQGRMRALGLPADCSLPINVGDSTDCPMDFDKIKKVHFRNRKYGGAHAASKDLDGKNITLTIHRTEKPDVYEKGYKFSFLSDAKVEISKSNGIEKGSRTDFGIVE